MTLFELILVIVGLAIVSLIIYVAFRGDNNDDDDDSGGDDDGGLGVTTALMNMNTTMMNTNMINSL